MPYFRKKRPRTKQSASRPLGGTTGEPTGSGVAADVFSLSKRSWFHLGHDGAIYIVNQKFGEKSSGVARLTRAEFERFKNFYERGMASLGRNHRN